MGMNHEFNFRWKHPGKIRWCQYLNTVVEQDHRRIKSRIRSMLGFKSFYNARRVLMGIELAKKVVKGQDQVPARLGSSRQSLWRQVLAG
jgi:transposase-like protein